MKVSRSHIECYRECPKKRYLRYHHNGTGVVPEGSYDFYETGKAFHLGVGAALQDLGSPISAATEEIRKFAAGKDLDAADLALAEAMAQAWIKLRLPTIARRYNVVAVEKDWEFDLSKAMEEPIIFMARPDAVLQEKTTGDYSALDFKTTGFLSNQWLESWSYDLQMNGHVAAIDKEYGTCESILLEVLYKGRRNKEKNIRYSPLVRGYQAIDPLTGQYEYEWDYKRARSGWTPMNVWEFDFPERGGLSPIAYWIHHVLDNETLSAQMATREFFRHDAEVSEWFHTSASQEEEVLTKLEIGERAFPAWKSRDCYFNRYYRGCCYREYCFGSSDLSEMVPRDPHHEAEFDD